MRSFLDVLDKPSRSVDARRGGERLTGWGALHDDEGGAVLLLCLAGILILMLMAWVVMDAGQSSRKRLEAQASADTAAYSQAAVKARAMNMMAYANISKRSIVGIHALYEGMYIAYADWVLRRGMRCTATLGRDRQACEDFRDNTGLLFRETSNDYRAFRGNRNYHRGDVRAIDQYQTYLTWMTPWWGWSEAVTRAQRNRATLATSYPPPPGVPRVTSPNLTARVIDGGGPGAAHNFSNVIEQLPVRRGTMQDMFTTGMLNNRDWLTFEHALNVEHHRRRSERGAALPQNIQAGATRFFTYGLELAESDFGKFAEPWKLKSYLETDKEDWLHDSSNIVFVFHEGHGNFTDRRNKYKVPDSGDYDPQRSTVRMKSYRPDGYWAFARSEISYQHDDEPDLWRAAWTARLRPMSLPDEFWGGGYDLNAAYHASINHLAFSAQIGSRGSDDIDRLFDDLVYMERVTRSMGQSTVEALPK